MKRKIKISSGLSYPLGAKVKGNGVNFAIASKNAEKMTLCLFSNCGRREMHKIEMIKTKNIFHTFVEGVEEGQLYGYRAGGDYNLKKGFRFNENKLLIDPYAKKLKGEIIGSIDNLDTNNTDNKNKIPKSVVVNDKFNWDKVKKPNIPLERTVIYEAHVKGLTMLNPNIPENLRGNFLGVCHSSIIEHLKNLGITAIELLPIHSFISESFVKDLGLSNYWGYNTLNYFSIHEDYGTIEEFKTMVKTFHENGIEVFMDVVYNHTCEGNEEGPSYSFKGIDNPSYYMLPKEDKSKYMNDTGCGNTVNTKSKIARDMILDSLKYFSEECQVDGFRFDLARSLIRDADDENKSRFLKDINSDKKLSKLKLIAEPWDIGNYGYKLGSFKKGFCEWNDIFRNSVRAFWKGNEDQLRHFAKSISGTEDIFENHDNGALSSVNFITAHDGFTLEDVVSYNEKHNEANLEKNNNGSDNNHSDNYGIEGKTDNPEINRLRFKQKKNLMATNILSKGIPMILSGDEIGNSQQGNNNAYCQDNQLGWINWDKVTDKDWEFYNFIKNLIEFRKEHEGILNKNFLSPESVKWYSTTGKEMTDQDWSTPYIKCLTVVVNNDILVIFNSHRDTINFTLPFKINGEIVLDTSIEGDSFEKRTINNTSNMDILSKSIMIVEVENYE